MESRELRAHLLSLIERDLPLRQQRVVIEELNCGNAAVSQAEPAKKQGPWAEAAGRARYLLLADFCAVLAAATCGSQTVPHSLNMDFLHGGFVPAVIRARARVRHHGHTTVVTEGEVIDEDGKTLAAYLATLLVTGSLEGVPRKW